MAVTQNLLQAPKTSKLNYQTTTRNKLWLSLFVPNGFYIYLNILLF